MVYGNNKLHRSRESLKSADKIVSATVTAADGSDVDLSDSISNLITIHYPNTVSIVRTYCTVNISSHSFEKLCLHVYCQYLKTYNAENKYKCL